MISLFHISEFNPNKCNFLYKVVLKPYNLQLVSQLADLL